VLRVTSRFPVDPSHDGQEHPGLGRKEQGQGPVGNDLRDTLPPQALSGGLCRGRFAIARKATGGRVIGRASNLGDAGETACTFHFDVAEDECAGLTAIRLEYDEQRSRVADGEPQSMVEGRIVGRDASHHDRAGQDRCVHAFSPKLSLETRHTKTMG
jgi:hypothetical protein